MSLFAPIIIFAYNRPSHLMQTLEALSKNFFIENTDVIFYCDGPKDEANNETLLKIEKVRNIAKAFNYGKSLTIHNSTKNIGLANSVIQSITQVFETFEKVIVLEDDLITSPYFIQYMNDGLNKYENESKVGSIHGYCYPIENEQQDNFFLRGADCWGWSTWKDRWVQLNWNGTELLKKIKEQKLINEFDFGGNYNYSKMLKYQIEGKNDSWAIRWYASMFLQNKLTLYPYHSLVKNIGNDNSGTHSKQTSDFETTISTNKIILNDIEIEHNKLFYSLFCNYFKTINNSIVYKIKYTINKFINE